MNGENKTSPLDVDFLGYLGLAILFDIIDLIISILELFIATIPAVSIFVDGAAALIIGRWLKSKGTTPTKGLKTGSKGGTSGGAGATGKLTGGVKQMIISWIIEQIPIVGLMAPTWTLNVVSTLEGRKNYYIVFATWFLCMPICVAVLVGMLFPSASSGSTTGQCGFNESKIDQYSGGGEIDPHYIVNHPQKGKEYAISIGVPEEDIKVWENPEDGLELFREEFYKQWPEIEEFANSNASDAALAQRAVLTYAKSEGGLNKFHSIAHVKKTSWWTGAWNNQRLAQKYSAEELSDEEIFPYTAWFRDNESAITPENNNCSDGPTYHPPSITYDKYCGGAEQWKGKNRQYALAWDIRFSIYVGVKEIFDKYKSTSISGTGEERWRNTLSAVWGGPGFWGTRSESAWTEFANEGPEVERVKTKCESMVGSDVVQEAIRLARGKVGQCYQTPTSGCTWSKASFDSCPPDNYPKNCSAGWHPEQGCATKGCFDCSQFTSWVYYWATKNVLGEERAWVIDSYTVTQVNYCNIIIDHATYEKAVEVANPGDLMFAQNCDNTGPRGNHHVMLYVGEGEIIHAAGQDYGVISQKSRSGTVCVCRPKIP